MPNPLVFDKVGKYIHYGLESTVIGESSGVYSRDGNIFQYVLIYRLD